MIRTSTVSIVGTTAVLAYAAFAAVQILVLNPLAAAPGRSLAEIHGDVAAAGESMGTASTIATLAVGVLLGVGLLVALRATRATPGAAVASYLGLLVLGAPAYFWAGFATGMTLADTYGISGGDHSPWGRLLYAVSLAALAALVGLMATRASRWLLGRRAADGVRPAGVGPDAQP